MAALAQERLLFIAHVAARSHRHQSGQGLETHRHLDIHFAQGARGADRALIGGARFRAIETRGARMWN
jgi:hypothetical protein